MLLSQKGKKESLAKFHQQKTEKTVKKQKKNTRAADNKANRKKSKAKKSSQTQQEKQVRKDSVPSKNTGAERKKTIPELPVFVPPPEDAAKKRFCDFPFSREILAATQDLGFKYCTEIQRLAIPNILEGRDLAAKAQTGTGKTAAFLATAFSNLQKKPVESRKSGTCRILVLAPTRELAVQIYNDGEDLQKYIDFYNVVVFGGMDHEKQKQALGRPMDLLVGTPGRIIDYSNSGSLDLSQTEVLIIDEADRMLDMGFIPDVTRIVRRLPKPGVRQTMLFSATLEHEVLCLVESWLVNPVSVESEPEHVVTDLIEQRFYAVLDEQKLPMLLYLLREEKPKRLIVFGNRKDKIRKLVSQLYMYGVEAELLSGDVPQEKRLKILDRFKEGKVNVLVATDVAARGIHVDGITHVVNFDLPEQPDDYVHRIGRTGRAGEKGISISFVCEYGGMYVEEIEKYAGIEIKTVQPEDSMLILPKPVRKCPQLDCIQSERVLSHGGHSRSSVGRRHSRSGKY